VKRFSLEDTEVLVPAYHHGVEVEALADAGARPRFYRIGSRWEVDLEDLERRIGPRTRALLLIHFAGFPGPTDAMRKIADAHGLVLIEDCAHALFSAEGERPLGRSGDAAIFCFYKTVPVPDGGALVINGSAGGRAERTSPPPRAFTFRLAASSVVRNLEMRDGAAMHWVRAAARGLAARHVAPTVPGGAVPGSPHFDRNWVHLGMSPLALRIALAQDRDSIVERRRANYQLLREKLEGAAPPLFDELSPGVSPLFYPLKVTDKVRVAERLAARGIETVDFWRFFHPACPAELFPEVAELRRTVIEIPCHQDLGPDRIEAIAAAVRAVLFETR
jgi:dTDP-4-amino-4,6-dideoxygalactose transaminase